MFVVFEFYIACVFFVDVYSIPAVDTLNQFISMSVTTTKPDNQNTVHHPTGQNPWENIEMRELVETLQNKLSQMRKNEQETTDMSSTSVMNMFRELDNSKNTNDEDSSKNNQATQLTILNTVYDKVSENIKVIHTAIQKNFDEIMKLNMLKGMLMEENIRSKGAGPKIKYMSKYKDLYLENKY